MHSVTRNHNSQNMCTINYQPENNGSCIPDVKVRDLRDKLEPAHFQTLIKTGREFTESLIYMTQYSKGTHNV